MSEFKRCFTKIKHLKEEPLFELLLKDIKKGTVFPAVRKDEIHFYFNGACLFEFSGNSFKCHRKFAGITGKSGRITEHTMKKELNDPIFTFVNNYHQIKDLCGGRFESSSGEKLERAVISKLYSSTFDETVINEPNNTIVLDIEVRYNCDDKKKCDLMLYNQAIKKLMLVEVKIFDDQRLKSKQDPEIFKQMANYTNWLNEDNSFIQQYRNYIDIINEIFDANINPDIKGICKVAKLLVVDEDDKLDPIHKDKLVTGLKKENITFSKIDITTDELWDSLI